MHLSYKTARYKGTIYKSYSIAESYREGNKVKKRIIWPIGRLTDDQAHQIRLVCKMVSDSTAVITTIERSCLFSVRRWRSLFIEADIVNGPQGTVVYI